MKSKISFFLLLLTTFSFAQVGIGTTSPNAQLDVQSSSPTSPANTDGILIPKIATFPATDPGSNQQGMLVYLTTATIYKTINKPLGFYYWDNVTANWIQIQTGSSNLDWNVTGNAATNPSTHFIGTTDNTDIVFKRNNVRAGFIGNPDTTTGNMNTSFGANALVNPSITSTTGNRNSAFGANALAGITSAIRNTAVGIDAMRVTTNGSNNVAVGEESMYNNISGRNNVAVGSGSLGNNVAGIGNVAVGRNSLVVTNADYNTGIGFATLRRNVSGINNVALGLNAGYEILGSNNVTIGSNAGYRETGSNKLYIHSSSSNTLANTGPDVALLYGEFDNKVLRVNGALQISNPATANGYALPTNRGTTGQVLQTDGAGGTSWVSNTVKPYTTTGTNTGIYTISPNEYTVRVFNPVSEVRLPSASLNLGKIFVIIGSNTISTKVLSSVSGIIYDDVAMSSVTTIAANQRYMVQSDGVDWIVIGN